jgi:hypothetical protein
MRGPRVLVDLRAFYDTLCVSEVIISFGRGGSVVLDVGLAGRGDCGIQ